MSYLPDSLFEILVIFSTLLITYTLLKIFYNVYLHPLRSYPGPFLCHATVIPFLKSSLSGNAHVWLHELHKQYGPVVRHAPDELSFIEAQVWAEVYGHKTTPQFQKDYKLYGLDLFGGKDEPGLIRANDVSHARQRKLVSHAFSDKALQEQQSLLRRYVELLVQRLKQTSKGDVDAKGQVNMVDWYNFTTFDIMADLTFGEPLRLLEGSTYTPWVRSLFSNMKLLELGQAMRHWPGLEHLFMMIAPKSAVEKRKLHMRHAIERVDKRLALKTDRPDIWTYILRHSKTEEHMEKGLSQKEMYSNSGLFMLAGTETTATLLSGLTYYLLKNQDRLERLQKEVRDAFSSAEEMTMVALSQLQYLDACIEEGLRIYPPVPGGLSRVAPKGGAAVRGKWIPEGMTVKMVQYAANHSPSNFKNPDRFIPERWLPEGQSEYAADHREVVQPFSTGPRACIGKNLAMMKCA